MGSNNPSPLGLLRHALPHNQMHLFADRQRARVAQRETVPGRRRNRLSGSVREIFFRPDLLQLAPACPPEFLPLARSHRASAPRLTSAARAFVGVLRVALLSANGRISRRIRARAARNASLGVDAIREALAAMRVESMATWPSLPIPLALRQLDHMREEVHSSPWRAAAEIVQRPVIWRCSARQIAKCQVFAMRCPTVARQ